MRRLFLFVILICFVLACERYPDPSTSSLRAYYFSFQNTQQNKFSAGEWVDDSVRFYALNGNSEFKDSVFVKYEVIKGGGTITVPEKFTNKYGIAATNWKLGASTFAQILRAKTYDLSGKYLCSSDLTEYGFSNDRWDSCITNPDGYMSGMVADTVNRITFMVANSALYKQGNRYYIWQAVTDPVLESPSTVNIDRNGVIYVTTQSGSLLKSIDHGESWTICTKPYPAHSYLIYISISNDNTLWVYYFGLPTRFSKDGGITWKDAVNELSLYGFGDVFRLKDGSLLFHASGCCSLKRSFDDGLTWLPIPTPGSSVKLYVNDMDEIFIITQENGVSIYKSTDYGGTFNRVYNLIPDGRGASLDNTLFCKWSDFYYVLIPGYGILRSVDLTHYEDYWLNINLLNLFIDQNGVLIAKDQNNYTVYYRKNSN